MRFVLAVALSAGLHVLVLATAWNLLLVRVKSRPDKEPSLQVCSMTLSAAEREGEGAPIVRMRAELPAAEVAVPVAAEHERPTVEVRAKPLPPDCKLGPVPEPPTEVRAMPEPQAAPRQARIEARLKEGCRIRLDYPRGARRRGEQGTVVLQLDVDEFGAVSSAKVVSSAGHKELDEAAVKAALAAKFSPATCEGRPVSSTVILPLVFSLR